MHGSRNQSERAGIRKRTLVQLHGNAEFYGQEVGNNLTRLAMLAMAAALARIWETIWRRVRSDAGDPNMYY
eukprot:6173686-Pleurochrysis_carterae.AAC.2